MAKYERVKYVGIDADGNERYIGGLPARDMDGDEWYAQDAGLRERGVALGLYEGVSAPKAKPTKAETDAPTTRSVTVESTEPAEPGEGGG